MRSLHRWNATALRVGYFPNMKYSTIVKLNKNLEDKLIDVPVWTALVQGNGKNILVDAGICNPDIGSLIFRCRRDEFNTISAGLYHAAGIGSEDIDAVLFTHLIERSCDCVIGAHEIDGLEPIQSKSFPRIKAFVPRVLAKQSFIRKTCNSLCHFNV